MCAGVPHFSSVLFTCLYQKYLSSKIVQLLEVLLGIDEQEVKIKKTNKINLFLENILGIN
jgi:hypothetical protein